MTIEKLPGRAEHGHLLTDPTSNLDALPGMQTLLRTDILPSSVQLKHWQQVVSEAVVPIRCVPSDMSGFPAEVSSLALGGHSDLSFIRSGPHEVCFDGDPNYLMWIVQMTGSMEFVNGAVSTIVEAGQARLYDPRFEHRMKFRENFSQLCFRFPRMWASPKILPAGSVLEFKRGVGALAWNYLRNLTTGLDDLSNGEIDLASQAAVGLFADSSRQDGRVLNSDERLTRVRRLIEASIDDEIVPTLSMAAKASGMSERTLTSLFASDGDTFSGWLMRLRLSRAARDLKTNPLAPIGEIAHRWQFSDQAHFGRSFRKYYGTTPKAYRGGY